MIKILIESNFLDWMGYFALCQKYLEDQQPQCTIQLKREGQLDVQSF